MKIEYHILSPGPFTFGIESQMKNDLYVQWYELWDSVFSTESTPSVTAEDYLRQTLAT